MPMVPAVVILLTLLLVGKFSSLEFDKLSCDEPVYCHCEGATLDCFFNDIAFDLPSTLAVNEGTDTVLIHGRNYSVKIPDKLFNESWASLEHLKITGSEKQLTLPFLFSKRLRNLKTLSIRNSNLSAIEKYAFSNMKKIIEIDLSNNSYLNVKEVEKGITNFQSKALKVFNISGIHNAPDMHQYSLSRDLFTSISSIEILDLSWSRAFWIDASLDLMPNLTSFNMSGTFIVGPTECFSTLNRLQRIETLAMDYWPTLARNGDVPFLKYDHHVVRRNSVNCIPTPFTDNTTGCIILSPSIKRIYMRYVQSSSFFLSFNKGFCALENNVELFTIRGLISSEPTRAINGFHKLKFFDLSFIGVHFETDVIADMPALETFLSSGNSLVDIQFSPGFDTLFMYNLKLKKIDLSKNELTYIPTNMFIKNTLLEVLDSSRNSLTYITVNFSANVHLQIIYLDHNKLTTIDSMLMLHLDYLVAGNTSEIELSLVKNELVCDCHTVNFVRWVQRTKVVIHDLASLHCTNSSSEDILIVEVDIDQLDNSCVAASTAESEANKIFLSVCIALGLFGAAILVLVVCLYRRRKLCFKNPQNEDELAVPTNLSTVYCAELEEIKSSIKSPGTFVLMSNGLTSRCHRNPKYTVFIAYCHEDVDFVVGKLYCALENYLREYLPDRNQDTLTLLYDKNFLPGEDLIEICKAAVYNSYVTVAIISENFLKSRWCSYEMQTAFQAEIPIIPLYIDLCEGENLSGIFKLIYDHKVRLLWPQETSRNSSSKGSLSKDEMDIVHSLATSIATYVRKMDSKMALDKDTQCIPNCQASDIGSSSDQL